MTERPYVSFAEVKTKVSIPDVLAVLGAADRFRRKGDTLTGVCPLPGHAHGPRPNPDQFKVNRKDGVWLWHCFGDCQRGGDVVELVKAVTGYDNAHVRFWFAEHFASELSLGQPPQKTAARSRRREKKEEACGGVGQVHHAQAPPNANSTVPTPSPPLKPLRFFLNLDPDVPYLKERGLTDDTIARFGLGLCTRGLLKGYVGIPIHGYPRERGANPVAYLGRWPGDDYDDEAGRPRYKLPPDFPKTQVVYGLPQALAAPADKALVVVEGPFGVFHLVQAGFASAVALLGSSMSDEQAAMLISTGRSVVLLLDGDEAGRHGARAAAGKLIRRTFVRAATLPEGKQPDHLTGEQLRELLT